MPKTIYLVKSFGAYSGYMNLRAFEDEDQAEKYAEIFKSQISLEALASGDESVEVEEITLMEVANA